MSRRLPGRAKGDEGGWAAQFCYPQVMVLWQLSGSTPVVPLRRWVIFPTGGDVTLSPNSRVLAAGTAQTPPFANPDPRSFPRPPGCSAAREVGNCGVGEGSGGTTGATAQTRQGWQLSAPQMPVLCLGQRCHRFLRTPSTMRKTPEPLPAATPLPKQCGVHDRF